MLNVGANPGHAVYGRYSHKAWENVERFVGRMPRIRQAFPNAGSSLVVRGAVDDGSRREELGFGKAAANVLRDLTFGPDGLSDAGPGIVFVPGPPANLGW